MVLSNDVILKMCKNSNQQLLECNAEGPCPHSDRKKHYFHYQMEVEAFDPRVK